LLSALFRAAIHAGKRARAETAIGCNPASVSSVAVGLAAEVFGSLTDCQVLIIGAGKTGELTAKALLDRGVRGVLVANRTYERAFQLAHRWGGQALTFERLAEALTRADIVISSTAAPHIILSRTDIEAAMAARGGRPLFLIDIAVPRDVDPTVRQLSGVHLYDIDDLQGLVEGNLRERRLEVPEVEAIVEEELSAFMDWFRTLDVVPTIAELRHRAEAIRRAELERTLRRLGDVSERERHLITAFSQTLVNKLLHHPTVRLKAEAQNGNGPLYARVVRDLFALE
jgi:glutamyl-tRNA reductase